MKSVKKVLIIAIGLTVGVFSKAFAEDSIPKHAANSTSSESAVSQVVQSGANQTTSQQKEATSSKPKTAPENQPLQKQVKVFRVLKDTTITLDSVEYRLIKDNIILGHDSVIKKSTRPKSEVTKLFPIIYNGDSRALIKDSLPADVAKIDSANQKLDSILTNLKISGKFQSYIKWEKGKPVDISAKFLLIFSEKPTARICVYPDATIYQLDGAKDTVEIPADTTYFKGIIAKVMPDTTMYSSIDAYLGGDSIPDTIPIESILSEVFADSVFAISYNDMTVYLPCNVETFIVKQKAQSSCSWIWIVVTIVVLAAACACGFVIYRRKKKAKQGDKLDYSNDKPDSSDEVADSKSDEGVQSGDDEPAGQNDEDIEQLKSRIKDIEAQKKKADENVERLNAQVSRLEENKKKVDEQHNNELENERAKWQRRLDDAQKDKERELAKKDNKINEIAAERDREREKCKHIKDEVTSEMQKKIDKVDGELRATTGELNSTKDKLRATASELNTTKENLSEANARIEVLKKGQEEYSSKITFVPYAHEYSAKILELLNISNEIQDGIDLLFKNDIEDPYHLFKAIAAFRMRLSKINMTKFETEVEMAAKKQMTFTGNGLANLASLKEVEKPLQVRQYYQRNFLFKYIEALHIFNETLIGMPKLIEDLSGKDIGVFVQIREKLAKIYSELQISVICPKLFESIGKNMDLHIDETIDANFEPETILEIKNCLVFSSEADRPMDKIHVKIQK